MVVREKKESKKTAPLKACPQRTPTHSPKRYGGVKFIEAGNTSAGHDQTLPSILAL